jgi:hypothetical protein
MDKNIIPFGGNIMIKQFKRSTNVEAVEFDNEWMILNADQYTVTRLNEVGGVCWSLLKQTQSIQALTVEVQKRYNITEQEAEADIESFLGELLKLGLVEYAQC